MKVHLLSAITFVALGWMACEPLLGLDGKTFDLSGSGGSGASSTGTGGVAVGGAGGGCGKTCGSPGCEPCPEVDQVLIDVPGGPGYLIDAFEVTHADYAAFVAADVDPSTQIGDCSFNDSFAPGVQSVIAGGQMAEEDCATFDLMSRAIGLPEHPITCVDWCDAVAYCAWAGKELCGSLSGGTVAGPISIPGGTPPAFDNPEGSAWFRACSAAGTRAYPYGDAYVPDVCNDAEAPTNPLRTGSADACEGGSPGLYDMSGNVEELVAECWNAPMTGCFRRGGAFYHDDSNGSVALSCRGGTYVDRAYMSPTTGFRCCAKP